VGQLHHGVRTALIPVALNSRRSEGDGDGVVVRRPERLGFDLEGWHIVSMRRAELPSDTRSMPALVVRAEWPG
jgi:hypothetical protein